MDMATDADINIEHRLTEVEQRAKSNTNRLNEHDEILKSNSEMEVYCRSLREKN